MNEEKAYLYRRVKLALQTGWTLEYIDNLGTIDEESIFQVMEAEMSAERAK